MNKIMKLSVLVLALSFAFITYGSKEAVAKNCGNIRSVSIANMSWESAEIYAEIIKRVIEDGYGCKTSFLAGDTVPTGASILAKGVPMIAPELWIASVPKIGEELKKSAPKVVSAGNPFGNGGLEGFWVPDYVMKNHGIKSVYDLKKNWKLFTDKASPNKGVFNGCPPGWGCEISGANLFKALGLEENFILRPAGTGASLKAAFVKRVKEKKPVVGYYWDPTAATGVYKLEKLEFPKHDPEKWKCIGNKECQNPEVTDYPTALVLTAVVADFKKQAPKVYKFLKKMNMPNAEVRSLIFWQGKNRANGEETAAYFFETQEKVWKKWVPRSVAKKIKSSL